MGKSEKSDPVDTDALGAIADDSISIFRTSLFLIVVYLTILSLVFRETGSDVILQIIGSRFTIIGITFWLGAMGMSVVSYRTARRTSLLGEYSNLGRIHDKFLIMNTISATMIGLFISVTSLIFGLLQGLSASVTGTYPEISIREPLFILVVAIAFVLFIASILSLVDLIRERYGPIRKILRLS